MTVRFIHLSDIHFGQEKGGDLYVNNDVKQQVLSDAADMIASISPDKKASGIIVSGDIAYGGTATEYEAAGLWLDELAELVGLGKADVVVVPGNHDVDRAKMGSACQWMLAKVAEEGEGQLDQFIESDNDRELLYGKFHAYEPFSEGYNCSLDSKGGNAGTRSVDLAPGRALKIVGLNSALLCSTKDKEGSLLLGKRQRVLQVDPGSELIVVCHHPLKWLQDSDDAARYVRSRARVLITGHEHKPSVHIENLPGGNHLLHIESGAMVPPDVGGDYNYTYNVLELDWDQSNDALSVTIYPRSWDDERKRFRADPTQGEKLEFVLGCEFFPRGKQRQAAGLKRHNEAEPSKATAKVHEFVGADEVTDRQAVLLLKFFRDLGSPQRSIILSALGMIPKGYKDSLSHAVERRLLHELFKAGRIEEVQKLMDQLTTIEGENN